MSRDEKLTVDITNRPSNRDRHSSQEWAKHIDLRESEDVKRDIIDARDRLGQFTVRFVTEAICGEEMAAAMFGEHGGQELVRDMQISNRTLKTLAGKVGGKKTAEVVERSVLREVDVESSQGSTVSQQQAELLRALLKTMSPEVIKKALSG